MHACTHMEWHTAAAVSSSLSQATQIQKTPKVTGLFMERW